MLVQEWSTQGLGKVGGGGLMSGVVGVLVGVQGVGKVGGGGLMSGVVGVLVRVRRGPAGTMGSA